MLNLRGKGSRVLPCSSIQQALVPTFSAFPVPKKSKRLSRIKLAIMIRPIDKSIEKSV